MFNVGEPAKTLATTPFGNFGSVASTMAPFGTTPQSQPPVLA